jgi:hypothetical protein
MKLSLFLFIFFFSSYVYSCDMGSKEAPSFAIVGEMEGEVDKLRHYHLFIPVKAGDMFFSGAEIQLASSFKMSLDFHKSFEYEGDYYIAYLAINPIHENNVNVQIGYNSPDKARNAIAFCGNYQTYNLTELLKVKPPKKLPQVPAPPPSYSDKDDV